MGADPLTLTSLKPNSQIMLRKFKMQSCGNSALTEWESAEFGSGSRVTRIKTCHGYFTSWTTARTSEPPDTVDSVLR